VISYKDIALQIFSVGENSIGSIQWPISENLPIDAKISYASRVIAHFFVANFVAMATGVGRGKMQLAAFDGTSQKIPYRRKNLLRKPSYSPFCPKFRCYGNGGRSGKMQLAAFDGTSWKPPYRRKNLLRKPSYSPFCPKFRCHSNGGRSGNNAIGSIRWPIPENSPIGAKISYASRVIAHFVPNFVAMATGVGRGKCNWQHSMAHPENPPIGAQISYASRVIAHFVPNFVAMATTEGQG